MFLGEESEPEFVSCLRMIVQTEDSQKTQEMWNKLEEMENLESGSKNSMYNCCESYDKYLRSILTENPIKNIHEIPRVLLWFSKFPLRPNSSNPVSNDIAICMTRLAEYFNESVLTEILEILRNNCSTYLSPHSTHIDLCMAIADVLSWMPWEDPSHMDSSESKKIILNLTKINDIINVSENISLIYFKKFLENFLKDHRISVRRPSCYIVIILQLVSEKLWKEHMDAAVKQIIRDFTDTPIINMLNLMCQWVFYLPYDSAQYTSMWLCLFIKSLEKNKKTRIPVQLAYRILHPELVKCIKLGNRVFYSVNVQENILIQLLNNIDSLNLFHSVSKIISNVIKHLFNSNKITKEKKCHIITIINILMDLLQRFKEHLSMPCATCENLEKMSSYINKEKSVSLSSHIPEESEEMEVSYPSTSNGIGRVSTSKVGLVNLGNTCYMNSVLQALAMTRQFCREVLLYKNSNDLIEQVVLKNLQNLFSALKYSLRTSLAPTEILYVSRPSYFMPGQQQDSSEFLCHLLDVMYEQEKSALTKNSNNLTTAKMNVEDKEMVVVEDDSSILNSPLNEDVKLNEDEKSSNMTRWTTEENLSEGASMQRKTQSLADFTQGEELAQTPNGLSDSHSDSTDSGIQSVGGDDSSSSSASSPAGSGNSISSYLVHRVFGGELKVSYQCLKCDNESHNTDRFRDLQLCFSETLDPSETVTVQNLIKVNYFLPETLNGDNKYKCDKCAGLCDAQRSIKIVQAPAHLILTLKHFRYNSESGLRTKLRRKVIYDEMIQLPVLDQNNEIYHLYAAVVHSGYSMDYGHYITYACDAKNRWYKFNDSYVVQTTIEDFKSLEPPDTPYILFYKKYIGENEKDEDDAPKFTSLDKNIQEFIERYNQRLSEEQRNRQANTKSLYSRYRDRNDDDDAAGEGGANLPPYRCIDPFSISHRAYEK